VVDQFSSVVSAHVHEPPSNFPGTFVSTTKHLKMVSNVTVHDPDTKYQESQKNIKHGSSEEIGSAAANSKSTEQIIMSVIRHTTFPTLKSLMVNLLNTNGLFVSSKRRLGKTPKSTTKYLTF